MCSSDLWAREAGHLAGIHLPVQPMEHHYLITEDIPIIAEWLLEHCTAEHGCGAVVLDETAKRAMLSYSWPGNIRELENLIERVPVAERYTYNYQGNSQTLDHLLWVPGRFRAARIAIFHRNADFATPARASASSV